MQKWSRASLSGLSLQPSAETERSKTLGEDRAGNENSTCYKDKVERCKRGRDGEYDSETTLLENSLDVETLVLWIHTQRRIRVEYKRRENWRLVWPVLVALLLQFANVGARHDIDGLHESVHALCQAGLWCGMGRHGKRI